MAMQKNPFVIASLPANPVNAPADLEGKRIGMALANMPVLQALCTLNGVDIDAIEVVPTQYSAQPLLAGEVDCLLCWETDLPVAMAIQGVESVTMLMADHGYAVHSQTYIATEDSLANRRAELVALMRARSAGWDAYRKDTDAAAELTVEMFPDAGLDLADAEAAGGTAGAADVLRPHRRERLRLVDRRDGRRQYRDAGAAGRTVTPDLWDRSILEEVHGA